MKADWDKIDRRILESRAADLAKPLAAQDKKEEFVMVLEFVLMARRYALPLTKIEAITRIGDIVTIPFTPSHITGIIRRGGQSHTLVSLRHFFNPRATGLEDADYGVVVNAGDKQFAIQVEDIHGVILISKEDLIPAPDNFDPTQSPYVSAVTLEGLVLIDPDRLINAPGFSMDSTK